MRKLTLICVIVAVLSIGCSRQDAAIPEMQQKIIELEQQNNALKAEYESASNHIFNLARGAVRMAYAQSQTNQMVSEQLASISRQYHSIEIDPTETGFQRLDANPGTFFVSCKEVTPYIDGYKVKLEFGNPLFVTYSGFELDVTWGGREPDFSEMLNSITTNDDVTKVVSKYDTDHTAWQQSLRKKTCTFVQELKPGAWNEIQFDLAPAKPEQVRYIMVEMRTKTVILATEKPPAE